MPGLLHCLSGHDLGFLRAAAELWSVNVSGRDVPAFTRALAAALAAHPDFEEITTALPEESRTALADLQNRGGRMPWPAFMRLYGEPRQMGPARRAREKPHFFPTSTAERLWYRALIGRDFFRQDDELVELAYIPDEFLERMPAFIVAVPPAVPLAPVPENALKRELRGEDRVLDDSCTLLAALRRFGSLSALRPTAPTGLGWELLRRLLADLGLIARDGKTPAPEARNFLEMPRGQSLQWLATGWMNSARFDELRLAPGILCQGTWPRNPLPARRALLARLACLEEGAWYAIEDFGADLRRGNPEYLRAGGDANEWIILSARDGRLLRRQEDWLEVEQAWVSFIVTRLLFGLGFVDLGWASEAAEPAFFRRSQWCESLLHSRGALELPPEKAPAVVSSVGIISLSRGTPRAARYQLARFGEWLEHGPERWQFLLTPASLSAAAAQGLNTRHLSALLRKYARPAPPPSLLEALGRWETYGREAVIERLWGLRLNAPETLQALRESPAASFLGDALGPASVIVREGGLEKVRAALARLGCLTDLEELPQ